MLRFGTLRRGTTTNDAARAGDVAEELKTDVGSGSSVSLTSNVAANLASLTLTPGDWDVSLLAGWTPAASTSITRLLCEITTVSATIGFGVGKYADWCMAAMVPGNAGFLHTTIPPVRFSLASTTTIYAVGYALFSVSTLAGWGTLRARRER